MSVIEQAKERPIASTTESIAGIVSLLGLAAVGAAFVDAEWVDFLPGENPFSTSDSERGFGAFRSIVKDLREDLPQTDGEIDYENLTTKQKISLYGSGVTFFGVMCGAPLKSIQVGGAGTIATLAMYEALMLPFGAISGGMFYGGAATIMYATALAGLAKKPSDPIKSTVDGIAKVKKVAERLKKK